MYKAFIILNNKNESLKNESLKMKVYIIISKNNLMYLYP